MIRSYPAHPSSGNPIALAVLGLVLGSTLALGACGPRRAPLLMSSEWPAKPQSLEGATKTWTSIDEHRAGLSSDVELVVRLSATYRSPAWRAAYVNHIKEAGELSAAEVKKLRDAQTKAAAEHHEFALLVATHDRRINDLSKGERSVWRMVLVDSTGAEVAPVEIVKDRRPPAEIRAELPHLTTFDEIYIARFPASHKILAGGAKTFSLKLWSARGGVKATWTDGK